MVKNANLAAFTFSDCLSFLDMMQGEVCLAAIGTWKDDYRVWVVSSQHADHQQKRSNAKDFQNHLRSEENWN